MHKNHRILLSIIIILSAITLGISIWTGIILFKSVNLGKGYIETSCTVQQTVDNSLCVFSLSTCYSQNKDIWWYNYWGSSYFIYISGADNGFDDDGNYNNDGDGGVYTGTYNNDDDDGGFDEGGEGGEGGFSIDGEMLRNIKKRDSTSGASDLSNIKEFKKSTYKQQQQQQEQEQSLKEFNNLNHDNFIRLNENSNGICNYGFCYQGIYYVQYQVGSSIYSSTIQGLVSQDSGWVDSYLNKFTTNSSYPCYYDSNNIKNVTWFEPPKFKLQSLIGFIISSTLFLLFIIMIILIIKKSNNNHSYSRIN